MPSALLINDVPIECINQAAIAYHVPATLIVSVLMTEGGKLGTAKLNKNGSYDYGPMQINTVWINRLKKYNVSLDDIQFNPCKNVMVGTWILGQRIADTGNLPYGIGSYNSYSLSQNYHYRSKVAENFHWLQKKLAR